jgi:hypothetical protein
MQPRSLVFGDLDLAVRGFQIDETGILPGQSLNGPPVGPACRTRRLRVVPFAVPVTDHHLGFFVWPGRETPNEKPWASVKKNTQLFGNFKTCPCFFCDCAVQGDIFPCMELRYVAEEDCQNTALKTGRRLSQLASSTFAVLCRGQGKFYATQRPVEEITPPTNEHFKFNGIIGGMCCFCALRSGLIIESMT